MGNLGGDMGRAKCILIKSYEKWRLFCKIFFAKKRKDLRTNLPQSPTFLNQNPAPLLHFVVFATKNIKSIWINKLTAWKGPTQNKQTRLKCGGETPYEMSCLRNKQVTLISKRLTKQWWMDWPKRGRLAFSEGSRGKKLPYRKFYLKRSVSVFPLTLGPKVL